MAEPTNAELLAEAEALRQETVALETQVRHWQGEAERLSILLKRSQTEEERLTEELAEAQRSMDAQYALLMGHRTQLHNAEAAIVSLQARLSATETHG